MAQMNEQAYARLRDERDAIERKRLLLINQLEGQPLTPPALQIESYTLNKISPSLLASELIFFSFCRCHLVPSR